MVQGHCHQNGLTAKRPHPNGVTLGSTSAGLPPSFGSPHRSSLAPHGVATFDSKLMSESEEYRVAVIQECGREWGFHVPLPEGYVARRIHDQGVAFYGPLEVLALHDLENLHGRAERFRVLCAASQSMMREYNAIN